MADTEILLESGTNEIEIMQFTINDELYGINVAKVREIMMTDKVKPIPHSHNAVEGIFKPREDPADGCGLAEISHETGMRKASERFIYRYKLQ